MRLPLGENCFGAFEAPNLVVTARAIQVDGEIVGTFAANGRAEPIPGLLQALAQIRARWFELNTPTELTFPGTAALRIDERTPVWAVKSVVLNAAAMGFVNLWFAAEPKGPLDAACWVKLDGRVTEVWRSKQAGEAELVVELRSLHTTRLNWRVSGRPLGEPRDEPLENLTQAAQREWLTHGVHRDLSDRSFDRAVVHIPDDTPFSVVFRVFDALQGVQRILYAYGGGVHTWTAFDATLAVSEHELAPFLRLRVGQEPP